MKTTKVFAAIAPFSVMKKLKTIPYTYYIALKWECKLYHGDLGYTAPCNEPRNIYRTVYWVPAYKLANRAVFAIKYNNTRLWKLDILRWLHYPEVKCIIDTSNSEYCLNKVVSTLLKEATNSTLTTYNVYKY